MNKIYKSVWSDSKGTFVAVSENTKAKGKSSVTTGSGIADETNPGYHFSATLKRNIILLLGVFSFGVTGNALAQVNSVSAGSNIIVTDLGAGDYTIGVSSNPTFTGTVTANGFTTGGAINAGSLTTLGGVSAGSVTSGGTITGGNFSTTGNVQAATVNATTVNATNVTTTNVNATGVVRAQTVNATTVNGTTVNAATVNATNVNTTNVTATGTISAANANITGTAVANQFRTGNVIISSTGINAGNQKITTLANGSVAAGSQEAVTGSQLYQITGGATSGIKYFHANSTLADSVAGNTDAIAIGPLANASGVRSTAIGRDAAARGTDSIVVGSGAGQNAATTNQNQLSLGTGSGVNTTGANITTIGANAGANTTGNETIAIGTNAASNLNGQNNVAIGVNSNNFTADAGPGAVQALENATAVGAATRAYGNGSVALGSNATVLKEAIGAIAVGQNASVAQGAVGGTSVGRDAVVSAAGGAAFGSNTLAAGSATAVGVNARAAGSNSVATGSNSVANGLYSISIGDSAGVGTAGGATEGSLNYPANIAIGVQSGNNVAGESNIGLGTKAGSGTDGSFNIAIGNEATIQGTNSNSSIAIGYETIAGADSSIAMGKNASSTGSKSVAVGIGSNASGSGAVALGYGAVATNENSVVLGSGSVSELAIGNSYITNMAPIQSGSVSVGSSSSGNTFQRRISNVADGGQDYDAVNVRQLRQSDTNTQILLGGNVSIANPNGFYVGTQRYESVEDAIWQLNQGGGTGTVTVDPLAVRFTGSDNSAILLGNGTPGSTTAIYNVKDGVAATDAVNVGQLEAAKSKYYSVKAGDTNQNNYNNDGATGSGAMAAGVDAAAAGTYATAIGYGSTAGETAGDLSAIAIGDHALAMNGTNTTAIGTNSRANQDNATAIGPKAQGLAADSIAIGYNATVAGDILHSYSADQGIAIGAGSHSSANRATALGPNATSSGLSSVATGDHASASGLNAFAGGTNSSASGANTVVIGTAANGVPENGVAIGNDARVGYQTTDGSTSGTDVITYGESGVALGDKSRARANFSTAVGASAFANGTNAAAVGAFSTVTAQNGAAFGTSANVSGLNGSAVGASANAAGAHATALGTSSSASGAASAALGANANARGQNAAALGTYAVANGTNAAALGANANANGTNATAIGTAANASQANATAVGTDAKAVASSAVALGNNANAQANNSIALGSGSQTLTNYGISTAAYTGATNNDAVTGVVSIGASGSERRITNVAGGQNATDAVNVSQLREADAQIDARLTTRGMNFAGNSGTDVHRDLGQTLNITGGNVSTGTYSGNNLRTVTNTDGIQIQMTDSPNFTNVNTTNLNSTNVNTTNLSATGQTTVRNFTVSPNSIVNIGGNQITNVTAGVNSTDVVNVSQLEAVNTTANLGWNVTTGSTGTGTVSGTTSHQIKPGDTATFIAGNNINIAQAGSGLTIATSMTPNFTTVTTAGDIDVGGDSNVAGSSTVAGNMTVDGTTTLNGNTTVNGNTVLNGNTSVNNFTVVGGSIVNMGGNQIHNVAPGTNGTDAVNLDQLVNTENKGLDFRANSGADVHRNLGQTLSITGEGTSGGVFSGANLRTVTNTNGIEIQMTDTPNFTTVNTTNLNSTNVNTTNLTVTGNTTVANFTVSPSSTVNMGGNRITNVAAGVDGTDAVNVDQLEGVNSTANAGWNLGVNDSTYQNIAPNGTVDLIAGSNMEVTRVGSNVTFGTSMNPEFTTVTTTGNATIGGDLNVAGATTLTGDTTVNNFTVNGGSVVDMGGNQITNVAAGTNGTDAVNLDQLTTTETDLTEKGLNFSANTGTNIHRDLGETLAITGEGTSAGTYSGANLKTVTNTTTNAIEIQMTDTPNFTTVNTTNLNSTNVNTTNLTATGNTTVANFTVSPSSTVNMGGNRITNVAAGVDGTDAVNVDQLEGVNSTANAGWNLGVNDGSYQNIAPNGTVDLIAGSNMEVTRVGSNVTFGTSMTPTFTTVNTTSNVNIGGDLKVDGATILNGNTTVSNFTVTPDSVVNMGGNQIINVAAGTNGTDAVNLDQLTDTTTDLTNKGLNFSANSGADVHRNLGDTLSITGEGTSTGTYSGANLKTVTNNNGIEIQMTDTPNFTTVNTTNLNSANVNTTNLTATGNTTVANFTVSPNSTVNMGGNRITNVGAGVDGTDAVNVDQLEGVNSTANAGWNLGVNDSTYQNIAPNGTVDLIAGSNMEVTRVGSNVTFGTSMNPEFTTVTTTGNATIGGDLNVTGATTLTGNTTVSNFTVSPDSVVNMGGNQITNVAAGTNGTDAVNVDQLTNTTSNLTSLGMNFADNAGTSVHRDLGQTLNITGGDVTGGTYSGDNLRTVANADGIEIQMTDTPNFTTVNTTNLNVAGDTVLNNTTIGGPGATFNVANGTNVNMGGNRITNVGAGVDGTDAVNVDQLEGVNSTANAGWFLGANDGTYQNIAPNGTVDLIAGSNMEVTRVGSNVTFGTSMNPEFTTLTTTGNANIGGNLDVAGDTTVRNFTVAPNSTVNMGGNRITNVAAGVDGTDAVNVDQLEGVNSTANAGWNLGINDGSYQNIAPNGTVDLIAGSNMEVTRVGSNVTFGTSMTPTFTTLTTTGNTNIGGDLNVAGDTVLNNTTIGGPGATFNVANGTTVNMGGNRITNVGAGVDGTDAVNVDQLEGVNSTANAGWNLGINDGTYQNIAPNGSVNLIAGSNMELVRDGANITFATVDAPTFTTVNTTNLTVTGDTVLNNTTIGGPGATFNVANGTTVNMGGNRITNVAPGVDGTDVVNVDQLEGVNATANAGWNLTANGEGSSKVAPGATVDFSALNDNVIIGKSGNNITVGIAQDLNLNSVTTGNATLSNEGLVIVDGPSVTQSGIDAGGKKITNVAAGTELTDAVNLGQLRDVENIANAGWNIGNADGLVGKVGPGSQVDFVAGNSNTRVNVTQANGTSQVQISAAPSALQYTDTNNANGSNTAAADQFTATNQVTLVGADATAPVSVNNVAAAQLSADSLQAVNGSQLFGLGESVADSLGGDSVFNPTTGKVETVLNVNGNTYNNVNDALSGIGETASAGWNLQVDGDTATNVAPGSTVGFNAGDNIVLERSGNSITVSTAQDVTFTSVTADTISAKDVKVSGSIGVIDGPTMTTNGIDAAGKTITNVAPGVNGTDAVNVNQLSRGLNQLDGKIERYKNDADGGTAAAMAMAGLPQAYLPGKSMFAIGGSTFQGQGGYAAGLSKVSENGSWVVKGSVSGSTRGQVGGSVGVGYQW